MAVFYENIKTDQLTIFTAEKPVDAPEIRKYIIKNWKKISVRLDNSTVLFIGGVHGGESGNLGENANNMGSIKKQFTEETLRRCHGRELLEDKERRKIEFKFLDVSKFYKKEIGHTKEIDENSLLSEIRSIDPQITFMAICYSDINDLKFFFERTGFFPERRMERDLNILSNGKILTLNAAQEEFIRTLARKDYSERDVVITGPVGSGKTILGLEAINIKKSHYKEKYRINPRDCPKKLRVIIVIKGNDISMLKDEIEMSKNHQDFCTLDIETKLDFQDSQKLTMLFKAKNYKSFSHTIIMIDDINRGQMQKCNFDEDQKVDYIYCLTYRDDYAVKTNFQALEVIDDTTGTGTGTVECNLSQRHRSSQEILDLVDYLFRHSYHRPVRKYDSISSFSSEIIPLWIEIADPKTFFVYFKHRFENDDVMLIFDDNSKSSNFKDIEEFCIKRKWRCTNRLNVTGSEASIIILYDYESFSHEHLTRAKNQLVIVTIHGKQSDIASKLRDIEKGNHNDEKCEEFSKRYKDRFGQRSDCEFRSSKSKIQKLVRKIHVDADGSVTDIQFDTEESPSTR